MQDRLSIGFINNFAGPTLGGGEVQLLELIRGLHTRGVDLALACAADSALASAAAEILGVRIIEVDFERGGLTRSITRGFQSSTVIHGTGFLTNIIARRVGHRLGLPVINAIHVVPGTLRLAGRSRREEAARAAIDRLSKRRVDRFVAVSGAVADALEISGVESERIAVVPNGIDVDTFKVAAAQTLDTVLPNAPRRVGYVGRLERVKGCKHFLDAAALIAQRDPEVRFIVAGVGSQETALLDQAAGGPVADRIDFLGYLPDVAPLYPLLSVVCVPSLSEAFGLSAVEALSLGVPVVASAVGGLPEVIVDGVSGVLVPPADPQAIADAVLALLDDPTSARMLGARGARLVAERFDSATMVNGYLEVYRSVVTQHKHTRRTRPGLYASS